MLKFLNGFPDFKQLIAVLKIIVQDEKNRLENKGITVDESRAEIQAR
jgi:hypothetical protein